LSCMHYSDASQGVTAREQLSGDKSLQHPLDR
jgi:hypothetical protein